MIVVDTNVISYFWLPSEYSENAKRLLRSDPEWVVPPLWRSEFRNVLFFYIRKKLVPEESAIEIMEKAEKMFKGMEYFIHSHEIISKVSLCTLSAYDLEYVVLAEGLGLKLITLDRKILAEFPGMAKSLRDY